MWLYVAVKSSICLHLDCFFGTAGDVSIPLAFLEISGVMELQLSEMLRVSRRLLKQRRALVKSAAMKDRRHHMRSVGAAWEDVRAGIRLPRTVCR